MKEKFTKLIPGEKALIIWSDGYRRYALVEKVDLVKIYEWDTVSEVWNICTMFEKIKGTDEN